MGRGFLTGAFDDSGTFPDGDFRANLPRFSGDNVRINQSIVEVVHSLAVQKGCTPAQVALAWLLSKGDNIVPIPGTKRIAYLEENSAACDLQLSPALRDELESSIARLEVAGERYTEEGMKGVNA